MPNSTNFAHMLPRMKVRQERPRLADIRASGFTAIDMHVHTRFSDSYTRVRKLIKKARKLKIGLAITDHNEIAGVERALDIKKDVHLVPGIEVSCAEGPHVLVYFSEIEPLRDFYQKYIQPAKSIDPFSNTALTLPALLDATDDYACVVSMAHPYAPAYTHVPNNIKRGDIDPVLLDRVDAIEVINGALKRRRNRRAVQLAENLLKGITGGSDSHSLFEFGRVVTYAHAHNVEQFLSAVCQQHTFVVGNPVGHMRRVPSLAKSSQKHMPYFWTTLPERCRRVIMQPVRYHVPIMVEKMHRLSILSRMRHQWQAVPIDMGHNTADKSQAGMRKYGT